MLVLLSQTTIPCIIWIVKIVIRAKNKGDVESTPPLVLLQNSHIFENIWKLLSGVSTLAAVSVVSTVAVVSAFSALSAASPLSVLSAGASAVGVSSEEAVTSAEVISFVEEASGAEEASEAAEAPGSADDSGREASVEADKLLSEEIASAEGSSVMMTGPGMKIQPQPPSCSVRENAAPKAARRRIMRKRVFIDSG